MKEYVKLYWRHTSEKEAGEPVIIIYEVDLKEDRYAIRLIDIYSDGHTENIEDKAWGFVTEHPVCTVEEINSGEYGEEFQACSTTEFEFSKIWHTRIYFGSLYFNKG
ncbi:DUF6881 domain-containing protein [Lacrimispora brassicae]